MSKSHTEKIKCPKCGAESDILIWETIDTSLDPQMKAQVRSGEAFRWKCTECGEETLVFYPIIYHQVNDRYIIAFAPGNPDAAVQYMNELSVDNKSGYTFDTGYTKRVVSDMNRFREKLLILDEGLDDRVIELMKLFVISEAVKSDPGLKLKAVFFNKDKDGAFSFALQSEEDKWAASPFTKENYDQVAKTFITDIAADTEPVVDMAWAMEKMNRHI